MARRQLLALGVGRATVDERVRSGRLTPVRRGVYAVGHRRRDQREQWMVGVLACGDAAVLSHASAAHLWGLRGSPSTVEATRASGGTSHRGIRLHQSALAEADVTEEEGIPVTTVERTLLDIAPRLDRRQMERVVVEADRSGRLRWRELERVIVDGRGRPGIGLLRRVARDADPRARDVRSPLEIDFLAVCRDAGLPRACRERPGRGPPGRYLLAREARRGGTRQLHLPRRSPFLWPDHRTSAELMMAGYEVLRVTADMIEDTPEQVILLPRRSLAGSASSSSGNT